MSYKKLSLRVNAFSDDAKKTVDELIKNEREAKDLVEWVESGSIVLMEGPAKSGKTRLAMEVIDNFRGEGKVVYIDLEKYNKEIDIGHVLIGNQPFYRKLLSKMPKGYILIVDNAHDLENDFYKRLQYFYDQDYLRSVILIKKADETLKLPKSIQSRVGYKIIRLQELEKQDYLKIATNRLQNVFNEKQLDNIWQRSGDFSTFLSNCEKVVSSYVEEGRKKLDNNFISKVLER